MSEPDDLEKIAQLAVKRGYWDARAALEGVAQARLHTAGPQKVFLRKLLERKCGLTYDELARLEKEALAPPVSTTPARPLPRLGAPRPATKIVETLVSNDVVIPQKSEPPKVDAEPQKAAETYVPPPRQLDVVTPKPLPRLNAPRKPKTDDPAPPT